MTTNRLEAFSDGVFAIAATLLILNVVEPAGPLGQGVIWINHHGVMAQIARVDRLFLLVNVIFLMLIAFIPFPTRLLAEHVMADGAQAAALAYGITLTGTAIMFNVMWQYAANGGRLLRENANVRVVRGITRSYLPGPFIYLVATVSALVSPQLSAVLYAGIALFYVLESSLFGGRT
jgi:uncharacterized membrane protein